LSPWFDFARRIFVTNPTPAGRIFSRHTKSRCLLQLRLTISTAAAVFFLAESLNSNFLRPIDPSQTIFAHICVAIFGVAGLVQAFALIRQLYREDWK
jgi:hypothetical protein